MKRKMKIAGAAAAVTFCVALVNAPNASAAGGITLWKDSGHGGTSRNFTGNDIEFGGDHWNDGSNLQNSASSMTNFSDRYVGLWDIGTSCTGASYTAKPNSEDLSFSNNNFNDKASCLKFI